MSEQHQFRPGDVVNGQILTADNQWVPYAQPQTATQVVVATAPPTSGSAVAALILSLVWLMGLGSVIALILVFTSWKSTRSGARGGHGLNVAALIIGGLGLIFPAMLLFGLMMGAAGGSS